MKLTRRDLGKLAVAAIPGAELFSTVRAQTTLPEPELFNALRSQRGAKPNSKFAGVQIGMNVPYNFGGRDMNPDELLDRLLKLNVSAVEMRSQPVETFLGSPAANGQKAEADVMRKWRASVSMDRVAAFRKKYEDAGVLIDIVKYDGIYTMADDEVNYCFTLARTLGARAISCEIDAKHTGAHRSVRRQAQASGRVSRPRGDHARALGGGIQAVALQLGQSRSRTLRRRQQHVAGAVPQAAPRAHFARAREGPQDEGRAERRRSAKAIRRSSKCCG